MDAPQLPRTPARAHPPKAKPDSGPMRLALGVGGIAALSALAAAIVLPPKAATVAQLRGAQAANQQAGSGQAGPASTQVQRPVRYVQLAPGQTAPPGATVISASAPTPVTVVVTVPAASQAPVTIKTTQSGKVVP